MSSFAKTSRGSRMDPKLFFGDEREHLPGTSMGEDAVDPRRRRQLGRYGQSSRGGDDRGRDRDDRDDRDGPPPSRAEENGWGRVSQPPAPGMRLTRGNPEGETNWRSNRDSGSFDGPPRTRGGGDRYDSRGPPSRYDSRDGGEDAYDNRRDSRFGGSRFGDSRFGRGRYEDEDRRFERRRDDRFGGRGGDRFARRNDGGRDESNDKFANAFSRGGSRWTRRSTSEDDGNNNSNKTSGETDPEKPSSVQGDKNEGEDGNKKVTSESNSGEGATVDATDDGGDNTTGKREEGEEAPKVPMPKPSRRWDALNTGKSTIRGKPEFRDRDGIIDDRGDPRSGGGGGRFGSRFGSRFGDSDDRGGSRDFERRGGGDYERRDFDSRDRGGRFGGGGRGGGGYDSRDYRRRDDYDSRDRFDRRSRYDDRDQGGRMGDRYDSRDSRPPYDSRDRDVGGGRFGGRGGGGYDSRDYEDRDDYDRRDRFGSRRDPPSRYDDRGRGDDGRRDARPAHLRFGKKNDPSTNDRLPRDSNGDRSKSTSNEPQPSKKQEMLRPLAKKKLQDHVKEYLNNYSNEMKMEKAVEIRRESFPETLRPDLVVWAISLSCDFDSVAQDRVAELLVECRQQRPPIMTSKEFVRGLELTVGRLPDLEKDCPAAKKIISHIAKICQNGKCWDEEDEASAAFCGVLALTTKTSNGDVKDGDKGTAVVDGKVETLSPLLLKFKEVIDKNGSKDSLDWTREESEELEAICDTTLKEQLKAIQIVIEKLAQINFPLDDSKKFKYVSEGVFHHLYDKDILPGEAFVAWAEDTTTEYEGKMNVLIQVTRYITWLKENDSDSESEEEDDD